MLLTIVATRSLPLGETGKFFSAFTVMMGLTIILQAGQPLLLLRKLGECKRSSQNYKTLFCMTTSNVIILNLTATLPIAIASIFFLDLQDPIAWVWVSLIPFSCLFQFSSFLKGMGHANKGGLIEPGIVSLVTALIALFWSQATALQLWNTMVIVSWAIMVSSYLGLKVSFIGIKLSLIPSLRLFLEAYHLWLITSLNYLSQWFGVIVAILFLKDSDIATLNAILRILAPLQFISLTIDSYLSPKCSLEKGNELLRLRNLGRIFGLILGAPYCLILLRFPELSIRFIYGDMEEVASDLVKILIVTGLILVALGPNGMLLQMKLSDRSGLDGVLLRILSYAIVISSMSETIDLSVLVIGFSISLIAQAAYNSQQVKKLF